MVNWAFLYISLVVTKLYKQSGSILKNIYKDPITEIAQAFVIHDLTSRNQR